MDAVPISRSGRLWKDKADFFRPFRTAATTANSTAMNTAAVAGSTVSAYEERLESARYFDPASELSASSDPETQDLNAALSTLCDVFPDVQPEVFREMLVRISKESRLELVAEQLLHRKEKWVRNRHRTNIPTAAANEETPTNARVKDGSGLTREENFRSYEYRHAVKQVLYQEFRSLSHSTIKAVLAEQNFSYTLSRPVLQNVAARSWRFSLASIWSRRPKTNSPKDHPFVAWRGNVNIDYKLTPVVKKTGSDELDRELYDLFVAGTIAQQKQDCLLKDFTLASKLNETEAADAEALFDCECCYASVTFGEIATCDNDGHILCLECVRQAVKEGLYGQGWSCAADLYRATVRCFASTSQECSGCLPADIVRRALRNGKSTENEDLWDAFQARITSDVLTQSQIPLQRCSFCNYAEVDEIPSPHLRNPVQIWCHIATQTTPAIQAIFVLILILMMAFTIPIVTTFVVCYATCLCLPRPISALPKSWSRVYKRRRSKKFTCRNPACKRVSCIRCAAAWHDPHTCFESKKTSLRTAIEASATAAVKRTCPKCLLSFVKSSGCNKLVCNCGYTMCYICRQEITAREGYSHFCQHFRMNGGRCTECQRCDLYADEDEDALIRGAVDAAEKAWREQEGAVGDDVVDDQATQLMIESLAGPSSKQRWFEKTLDAVVDACAA